MSIEVIKSQIDNFLSNEIPEVMAIKGSWGIGKTYSWNKFLLEAKENNRITLKKYSYVSLFGINSLDAFKYAIFEQIVDRNLIGTEANIETFRNNIVGASTALGKKGLDFFKSRSTTHAIESFAFLSLSNTIICIDDLERKGKSLDIQDVLGLVSLLKEQKQCKVVLLLNDGEEGLEAYIKYREKVVDFELEFLPTAEESAKIAFDGTELNEYAAEILEECTIKLNIKNIRILKKIERLVKLIIPYLKEYEQEITHQGVHSLTLFSWCYFCHNTDEAPSLDVLINLTNFSFEKSFEADGDEHKKWKSIIHDYGYRETDEFDLLLSTSVRTGYFIEGEVKAKAAKKNKEIVASKSEGSFHNAWDLYHESFDDNQNQVITTLYKSFKKNVKNISPGNLDGTVCLFRELGENGKAEEIIDFYIDARNVEIELFNPDSHFFGIKDSSMSQKFNATYHSSVLCEETTKQVLERLSGKNGWNQKDEIILSNTTVDQYYEIFKSTKGRYKRSSFINTCLQFGRFSNASDQQKEIANRATEALKRIAKDSEINKSRVILYEIQVDDE
ncbi:hypothetical protein [Methylobacter svalbardensis]|uniref:hypothetical protein n=1 Tax=Methylobacter svalbardensis TaxID=3080016 RepID=UPI0030EF5481